MRRPSEDEINAEVARVLRLLQADFEACHELLRRFSNLPLDPGIYGLKTRSSILYIGKAANIRTRFQAGHRCLSDALIDGYRAEELRIAAVPVVDEAMARILTQIEGRLLLTVRPPYNVLYPTREI